MTILQQTQEAPGPLAEMADRFVEYVPTLAAGLLVLAAGVAIGWLVKRATVRVLIWLRLDRLGGRLAWRAAFGKGDVRAALYNLIGTIAMVLVVLLFLGSALDIWGLEMLSRDLDSLVVYFPNLVLVALIVGVGIVFANTISTRVEDALEDEGFERPRLVARALKAALLAVVGALALWQLNFAREIVLSAFLIGFGAIGIAFAVGVGLGSAKAIQKVWESFFERSDDS
jgi:hypothetical protein